MIFKDERLTRLAIRFVYKIWLFHTIYEFLDLQIFCRTVVVNCKRAAGVVFESPPTTRHFNLIRSLSWSIQKTVVLSLHLYHRAFICSFLCGIVCINQFSFGLLIFVICSSMLLQRTKQSYLTNRHTFNPFRLLFLWIGIEFLNFTRNHLIFFFAFRPWFGKYFDFLSIFIYFIEFFMKFLKLVIDIMNLCKLFLVAIFYRPLNFLFFTLLLRVKKFHAFLINFILTLG